MNHRGASLIVCLTFALCGATAAADDPKPPAKATTPSPAAPLRDTSALVEAARAAKANRGKNGGRKVITNADVKRSTAKLRETQLEELPPDAAKPVNTLAAFEAARKARREAEEQVAAAEKKAAELEKEVSRLEMSFYEENDPNYRDNVIQKRFEQAKRQLDDARQVLADARDAAKALGPKVETIEMPEPDRSEPPRTPRPPS